MMTKRIVVVMMAVGLCAAMAQAGLSATGDVIPADPATWTTSTRGYIGNTGWGSVTVDGNSDLVSKSGYIGYNSGSTGAATVSGAGSTWTNSNDLTVGCSGSATLDITDGGSVGVGGTTYVGLEPGSSGKIHFDNGTLTTHGLLGAVTDLSGTGTIHTNGLVSDVDLVFDATHGLSQSFTLNGPGQNIAVNLDVVGFGAMGAGYKGSGSMHIADGVAVPSASGYIGYGSGSTGVVAVSGAGSTWTTGSSNLSVGSYGSGTLDITAGGAVSSRTGYIGYKSGSTGAVTVSGAGSTWTNYDYLYVGQYGSGTLNITDGAAVSSARGYIGYYTGSTGVVTVSGVGSIWISSVNNTLDVGIVGSGTLNITAGGAVSSYHGTIGGSSSSTGVVTVAGAGSTWTNSDSLLVGSSGSGTLNITDGGAVSNSTGTIGLSSGSTGAVTVAGAGSTWTNSAGLHVGSKGNGTLNITSGGAVSNSSGYIGASSGSTGAATVDGPGSTWRINTGNLYVGYSGSGRLDITDGGAVSSNGGYVGFQSGSTGVVTISGAGSIWTNAGDLSVGSPVSGALRLYDGGMTTVAGNATLLSTATLDIGLSGAAVESYLNVTGTARLSHPVGGTLKITLLPSLVLTPGVEFLVLDAGSLSGAFKTVNFPNAQQWCIDYDTVAGNVSVGFLGWSVGNFDHDQDIDDVDIDLLADAIRTGSTNVELFDISADGTTGGADGLIDVLDLNYLVRFLVETTTGHGTEYGDFNLDGLVDTTDLTRLATNYGLGTMWSEGNANRHLDLAIDTTDLTILATYYGFGASADAVPEPATLGLLAVGACLPLFRKKRR